MRPSRQKLLRSETKVRHSVRWFSRPKLRISRLKSLSSKDRLERKVQTNVQFSFSWERKAFLYKIVLRGIRGFLHAGAPNGNFRENICSEDDLRSRIFGAFVVKFLACLPPLGFSNIYKMV